MAVKSMAISYCLAFSAEEPLAEETVYLSIKNLPLNEILE
jgi:hypothetical protein